MKINKPKFYDSIRASLFANKLSQPQVEGLDAILDEWETRKLTDIRWLAYILGTVYHETAKTMQPIEEYGKGKGMPYGKKLKMGNGPNKRVPYTTPNHLYFGRGLVQATWWENYNALSKAAKKEGREWDFLNNPDELLKMKPSVWSAYYGMTTGLYTGKKLSDYFNEKTEDWIGARKIINGTDKAKLISDVSKKFYCALT